MSLLIPYLRMTAVAATSTDSAPTAEAAAGAAAAATNGDRNAAASAAAARLCTICGIHRARYTCAKCRAPYCSVACYRTHGSETKEGGGGGDGGACAESFYKDRVAQVLRLEVEEKSDDMRHILNRVHHQMQQRQDCSAADDEQPVLSSQVRAEDRGRLSRDELVQLLSLLEKYEGDEAGLAQVLSQQSSSQMQAAIDRVMQELAQGRGDASLHDWILEPWYPWWRTELVALDDDEDDDDESDDEDEGTQRETGTSKETGKTLDERILAVPVFETLFRPKQAQPPPLLQYNLVDILYSAAGMLRLYHGLDNALELPLEACTALVEGSAVLSQDARFETLEEVLADCARRSTTQLGRGGESSSTPWTGLAQDVAFICQNHRLVARAVLEVSDVVKASISVTKNGPASDDGAHLLRRIRKKLQFYLSWSLANTDSVVSLSDSIQDWIADWKLPSGDDFSSYDHPLDLQLPSETRKNGRRPASRVANRISGSSSAPLLLEQVESKSYIIDPR